MKRYYVVISQLRDGNHYTDLQCADSRESARKQARQALKCGGYTGVKVLSTRLYKD